jgi:pimeloyl-ACP methyl ester carboxylesterase
MFKLTHLRRFACSSALCLAAFTAQAEPAPNATPTPSATVKATTTVKSGRQTIQGVNYYYEIRGKGEPLLLLHGGLGSIDMFGPVLDKLAESRLVIAVDLHGHGRTPLGTRPFRLETIADDMATLAKRLGHPKLDVMGYSLGGGVALRMGLQKPAAVRRLVLVSTSFSDDGFYADLKKLQAQVSGKVAPMMKDTPMYKSYAAVAPKVSDFPRLLDALGDLMRSKFDLSSEVPKLKMPVMLVYGDSDMFRPEHVVKFYQLLGGGMRDAGWGREGMSQNRLAILPDLTHYEIFASPRLTSTVLPFLNGTSDVKSWADQVSGSK